MQGKLHVRNPDTDELEAVSAAAALADHGLRGLDGAGRTVMRVVALSTAAGPYNRALNLFQLNANAFERHCKRGKGPDGSS